MHANDVSAYRLTSIDTQPFTREQLIRDWGTVRCSRFQYAPIVEPQTILPEMDGFILHVDGVAKLRWRESKRWHSALSYRGGLTLTPREMPLDFLWNTAGINLLVYFPPAIVQQTAETLRMGDPTKIAFAPRFDFRDPQIVQLCTALLHEMVSAGRGGRVYAQTLGDAFLTYAIRTYATTTARRDLPHGTKLTEAQVAHVRAYILDNLALDFGIHDLAAYIRMGATHFVRCFRRTTGLAPHQYVIRCRVEQARLLLCTTQIAISQVALLAGFYDQSHLTHHVERAFGLSPGALRGTR